MCEILEKIKDLTPEQLLQKYDVEMTPPIDLAKLIKNIGISSYPYEFDLVEKDANVKRGNIIGAALSFGDRLHILYSKNLTPEQARVTIAHELGHCCLHAKGLEVDHIRLHSSINDIGIDDIQEKQADRYAENLLMPLELLNHICSLLIKPTVTAVADIFQVPISFAKKRLQRVSQYEIIDDSFTETEVGENSDE